MLDNQNRFGITSKTVSNSSGTWKCQVSFDWMFKIPTHPRTLSMYFSEHNFVDGKSKQPAQFRRVLEMAPPPPLLSATVLSLYTRLSEVMLSVIWFIGCWIYGAQSQRRTRTNTNKKKKNCVANRRCTAIKWNNIYHFSSIYIEYNRT